MLNADNIALSYGNIKVIHDVSFKVEKGEIVALIGGNGNGKSTLLKGISGIMHPLSGASCLRAAILRSLSLTGLSLRAYPLCRKAGDCSEPERLQEPAPRAYLTSDAAEIAQRLDYVYDIFPILKERTAQKAKTLSGGEQQMVAIARGLMSKPKLLLLDEPSWGIAPKLVDKIFEVIREIRKDGVTIVLVEQDVQEALDICDRAYVIQTGRVVLNGAGKELLSSDLIQKAFLGL